MPSDLTKNTDYFIDKPSHHSPRAVFPAIWKATIQAVRCVISQYHRPIIKLIILLWSVQRWQTDLVEPSCRTLQLRGNTFISLLRYVWFTTAIHPHYSSASSASMTWNIVNLLKIQRQLNVIEKACSRFNLSILRRAMFSTSCMHQTSSELAAAEGGHARQSSVVEDAKTVWIYERAWQTARLEVIGCHVRQLEI